ncbi:uncharacterized protein TNCV_2864971 [Trichonephila clavipes]|nr:uncharacterized protein TNCV_2864971 [Trichonephila clavipes]
MSLNKLRKDKLKIAADELNLSVPEGAKIAGLKSLIVNSDVYKKDKELVQSAIDYALAEIKDKRLDSETKLEFERIKLVQLQKQLELANIQNLPQNSDIRNQSVFETAANINVETLLKSVKTLTIPVPSRVELYNLFFQSLEKAFKIKKVPEQFKGEILLNILGERVNNLLVHVSEEELNNYKKSTTKLRVVFNCSSLTDNGIPLNDIQYNGGVIQEDLYAQMLRFRTYTYAFTAGIKMMYRTILINPKQHNLQRIIWCESEHESPKIYELSTVTYGTVSAPYLAQRTLTQLSMDEEANFPIATSVLWNNSYMDDVLCGAATLERKQLFSDNN